MKRTTYLMVLFVMLLMGVTSVVMGQNKPFLVVLDAGHGGHDAGAVGRPTTNREKDINLAIALKVGKLLQQNCPDVQVLYTRSTDVFVTLSGRADIANKAKADLFVSIHTNAIERSASRRPMGVQSYTLTLRTAQTNLEVEKRENSVIQFEADGAQKYSFMNPNSPESEIMFELMQNSYMDQSLQFASQVQQRFVNHLNRDDRGVRQAAFWVLLKTACPSVLFEMGFISNPEEERFLNQDASIAQMANAIVNAFGAYTHKQAVRKENLSVDTIPAAPNTQSTPKDSTIVQSSIVQSSIEPTTYYAIQIFASKTPLDLNDARLKGQPCDTIHAGEWIKYYTAASTDRTKTAEQLPELKNLFPDCWIITFKK